jgi:spermidine synthase
LTTDGIAKSAAWSAGDTIADELADLAQVGGVTVDAAARPAPASIAPPAMAATVAVFAGAIFTSAFLLFWMQPLFAKMVLPLLGGSPSVWNTAMMFFQLVLLAGYAYAHLLTHRFRRLGTQVLVHGAVVAAGVAFLPFAVAQSSVPPAGTSPILWLVGLLAVSVGWPFFALSASAPLLQSWFARSGHRLREDPYFLYAASNLGSLLALLAFPVLFEPELTLAGQARFWTGGYATLFVLLAVSAWLVLRSGGGVAAPDAVEHAAARPKADWRQRATWIALAAIPSSLLLGVTTYISADIASAPLLWVVPLALYLLSFVIGFARTPLFKPAFALKAQAFGIVIASILAVTLIFDCGYSVPLFASVHLLTFFATAVVCHSELARRRPAVDGLTAFYFCMSIGGAIGGVFNALVAPVIFSSDYEYYLALAGACALRSFVGTEPERIAPRDVIYPAILGLATAIVAYSVSSGGTLGGAIGRVVFFVAAALAVFSFVDRPWRLALGVAAMIGGAAFVENSVNVLHTERSFFGINKIRLFDGGRQTALIHGTTLHGIEFNDPKLQREPLAYYTRSGPVGQALAHAGLRREVAAIGLGTGALACYRTPGESWTFFEIDDAVERIARDARYFHYLSDCGAGVKVALGDGRLSLKAMPDRAYDLIIIDAFSSDSVPAHLLTREALALYLHKLKPHGFILANISNKYLRLEPVLASAIVDAGAAGLDQRHFPSAGQNANGAFPSEWMAIAATSSDLGFLASDRRWRAITAEPNTRPWTDDFSNIFRAIRW